MREQKFHIYLDSHERTILLHSLVELKNQLLAQGRYAGRTAEKTQSTTRLREGMMDGVEFKELFKAAVETLREKTITPLLEADATYQEEFC